MFTLQSMPKPTQEQSPSKDTIALKHVPSQAKKNMKTFGDTGPTHQIGLQVKSLLQEKMSQSPKDKNSSLICNLKTLEN